MLLSNSMALFMINVFGELNLLQANLESLAWNLNLLKIVSSILSFVRLSALVKDLRRRQTL